MGGKSWAGCVARAALVTMMTLGTVSSLPMTVSHAQGVSPHPVTWGASAAGAISPNVANLAPASAASSASLAPGSAHQGLLLYQTQYTAKKGHGGHGKPSGSGPRPKRAAARRAHVLRPAARARVAAAYGALPTAFELNQGQTDPRVAFLARGAGATLFLTAHDAVLSLPPAPAAARPAAGQPALPNKAPASAACPTQPQSAHGLTGPPNRPRSARGLPCDHADQPPTSADVPVWPGSRRPLPTVVRFGLLGTNPQAHVVGLDRLPGVVNYYIGNDRSRWHTHVPTYAEVSYRAVYKGVDLVYHGRQGQLEYDFDVAPGADPSAIQLLIEGGAAPRLDGAGNLVVGAGAGARVLHEKPVAYQTDGGARRPVAVRYVLEGGTAARGYRVGFAVDRYDPRRPLVIDPVLYYATYLGGSQGDFSSGQGADAANGLAVDSNGRAYVAGTTYSSDFPTSNGAQSTYGTKGDAFISVFQPDGAHLAYSTYLGGSGSDIAKGIAVDDNTTVNGLPAHNAYVTGSTTSGGSNSPNGFPMRGNGYQQTNCSGCKSAFVAELQADGTLVASTFLHSTSTNVSSNEGTSEGNAIASYQGSAYVAGDTTSLYFPTTANTAFQTANEERGTTGFVTELAATVADSLAVKPGIIPATMCLPP